MSRRAELVEQTRQRITEAAMRLHTTVGPTHTSISTVAEEAGVTRLTVYRHFADLDALFEACRGHWRAQNPPPDPIAWGAIPDLEERARRALGELYRWYLAHGDELFPIYRDKAAMPVSTQQAMRAENQHMGDALIAGHVGPGPDGRPLRAVARHLVHFWTWRSLVVDQDLEVSEAVDLAVRFLVGAAQPKARA